MEGGKEGLRSWLGLGMEAEVSPWSIGLQLLGMQRRKKLRRKLKHLRSAKNDKAG
jgi:hypothetical protein